jgi:hypothetical protein
MRQNTVERFEKAGHIVVLKEIEIGYPIVESRRHIVFSKVPGAKVREFAYTSLDSERLARGQFEFIKSLIELNA